MKERRGPFGRTVGAVAQSLADAARRRQSEREPRVLIYDEAGHSTLLHAATPDHDGLVEAAERLVEAAGEPPPAGAGGGD
jgi:hypothetical protein